MFKINGISHDKQFMCPLCWTWSSMWFCFAAIKQRCNCAAISVDQTHAHNEEDLIKVGRYYITLMTEGKMNTWYVASCERKNPDGTYEMDHVSRVQRGPDLKWKQPAWIDKINLQAESIIECGFDDEWDILQEENMTFTLWNHAYISNLVKTMFTWEFELFYIMAQFWHFFAPFFMVWMMPGSLITSECSWAVWVILEAHMHQQYSQLWEFCGLIHFKCTIFTLWAPICLTFEISWLSWLTN